VHFKFYKLLSIFEKKEDSLQGLKRTNCYSSVFSRVEKKKKKKWGREAIDLWKLRDEKWIKISRIYLSKS